MVDAKVQLRHVVDSIVDEKNKREVSKYLYGVSCSITKDADGSMRLNICTGSGLEFLKNLLGVETQHCYQFLSVKKVRRLRHNMNQGYFVFIRDYDPESQDVEDFVYKKICRIYTSLTGWKLELSDGEIVNRRNMNARYLKAFKKYADWSVFEDVTFFMHEKMSVENPEQKYIQRMTGRMRCISRNKRRGSICLDDQIIISDAFVEQRDRIYKVLSESRWIRQQDKTILFDSLSEFKKKTISVRELYKCFEKEYQVFKAMEERVNEDRDCDRIRNLRDDLRLCTG